MLETGEYIYKYKDHRVRLYEDADGKSRINYFGEDEADAFEVDSSELEKIWVPDVSNEESITDDKTEAFTNIEC